jgi:spore germination protein GerM
VTRAALVLLMLVGACRSEGVTIVPRGELPDEVYDQSRTTGPEVTGLPDEGTVYLIGDGRLVPERRALPEADSLPEALLEALLEEPSPASAIPPDTRVLNVVVGGGVATVDLSEEFEQGAAGHDLALRVAQVVYTLTEQPSIRSVLFAIEGEQRPVIAGNLRGVLNEPVTRQDYARFAPA